MRAGEQRLREELLKPWKDIDSCDCPAELHRLYDEGAWERVLEHPAYLRHVQQRAKALRVPEVAGMYAALPVMWLGPRATEEMRLRASGPVVTRIKNVLSKVRHHHRQWDTTIAMRLCLDDLMPALDILNQVLPPEKFGSRTADLRQQAAEVIEEVARDVEERFHDGPSHAGKLRGTGPPQQGFPAPTPRKWRPDRTERLERVERMLAAYTFTTAHRELDEWQADTTDERELAEIDELRAESARRAELYRIRMRRESIVRLSVVIAVFVLVVGLVIWAVSLLWPW